MILHFLGLLRNRNKIRFNSEIRHNNFPIYVSFYIKGKQCCFSTAWSPDQFLNVCTDKSVECPPFLQTSLILTGDITKQAISAHFDLYHFYKVKLRHSLYTIYTFEKVHFCNMSLHISRDPRMTLHVKNKDEHDGKTVLYNLHVNHDTCIEFS